jgi:redox-sensitive bicupin YhaK (pirin superfamily)
MFRHRLAQERGLADHGWLKSYHSFSFADYYDPKHMGFRALRVINEDRVQPGHGFGAHSHRDMEIISYVLEGGLRHKDSIGTGSVIRPGDVQRMSAGRGVTHSEHNASEQELVHFLQIWLLPSQRGLAPSYEQKAFLPDGKDGKLQLVASGDGRDGSVTVHCDARLYIGSFGPGQHQELELAAGRHAWVQVTRGALRVQGHELSAGDGAALSEEPKLTIEGCDDRGGAGEALVFDLA